jgi:hypothetical protein
MSQKIGCSRAARFCEAERISAMTDDVFWIRRTSLVGARGKSQEPTEKERASYGGARSEISPGSHQHQLLGKNAIGCKEAPTFRNRGIANLNSYCKDNRRPRRRISISLEIQCPVPVFLRSSLGAAFLAPQNISTLANVLFIRLMPIVVRAPVGGAVLLP